MFLLRKWYCDSVSPEGDVFLGYWARLTWGPVTIPYVSGLYKHRHHPARERSLIRSCAAPALDRGTLEWDCRGLGIKGHWRATAAPCERVLLNDAGGSITWRCHIPAANSRVILADAAPIAGAGYAEELTMTVRPWLLPMDELRWGRFVSPQSALTWIEWRGRTDRQWVFLNGAAVAGAAIGGDRVRLAGNGDGLHLNHAVCLRDGPLARTALRRLRGARRWLLRGIEDAHETKWLSQGTLTIGARACSGWAIHEVVRFR